MSRYQRDVDDNQESDQGDQQQDNQDDDNRPGQQQDDDGNDNDSHRDQNQQQHQGDEDDDDNNNTNVKAGEVSSDDVDNNNAGRRGQLQDDNGGDDHDDDEEKGKASQQQDDDADAANIRGEPEQDDDDDIDEGRPKVQDDDDDDEQKASNSSNVNIVLNIGISANLEDSELHKGGIIWSKKLLAQLFSGPGEHDPDEEEVPIHKIQHEHLETADSGEWTIVELKTQDANGASMYLKARLDSGADDNFMSLDIFNVTGLELTCDDGPEGPLSFTIGDGQQRQSLGTVRLEYTAGKKPQKFIESFQILKNLPYDVILGAPLMKTAHMMMVNPNYANPPNHPALCVLVLGPKTKDLKKQAEVLQRREQKIADQEARDELRRKAQGF